MRKSVLALLVLAAAFVFPLPAEAGYEDLFRDVRAAAWAVYVRTSGGMNAICSASAYSSRAGATYMLTAGHCFLGSDLLRTDFLVTQDHRNFVRANLHRTGLRARGPDKAMSTSLDDYRGNDWAVIRAEIGPVPTLPLGDARALTIGEDLVVVGVPFGMDFLAVQGIVGSLDVSLSQYVWNHYYGANVFVAGGNSGSGVVSVRQRALVGIVDAGPGSQSSMMIFAPVHLMEVDTAGEPRGGYVPDPFAEKEAAP